ncbi:hypothetical protein GCM10027589_50110 [Actinocorallia lasiicapitis]
MKFRTLAVATITTAAGALFAITPATGAQAFVNNCWRVFASSGVNVRSAATSSAGVIGSYANGAWVDAWGSSCDSSRVHGQTYTACGTTSDWWSVVNYNGKKGYAIRMCMAG